MMKNEKKRCRIYRLIALLIVLALIPGCFCAAAQASEIPHFGGLRTDATVEDFIGTWSLRWIYSENPADISVYGYVDIYPNGHADVNIGGENYEHYYSTTVEEAGGGYLYAPMDKGSKGYNFFLTEDGVLGCVENPGETGYIRYMEYCGEVYTEDLESEQLTETITGHIGEQRYGVPVEELQGRWCASEYSTDDGDLCPVYMANAEISILIEGERATFTQRIGDEESAYETPVWYDDPYTEILDEDGEESLYLIACADGRLALVDAVVMPEEVIFFLPEALWEAEMANIDYDPNPQPGEMIELEDLEAIAGEWTATHINYGGLIYSTAAMGLEGYISVYPGDGIVTGDGDTFINAQGVIEDGHCVVTDEEESEYYLFLFEGGYLVQSEYADDLSLVTYYQRLDG